ncbi:MAG TPA: hypothetical protein VGK33_20965, partial [Chloroflexota bacterium]
GTTAGGPAIAFAGWSATTTTPAGTQLQSAEAACEKDTPSVVSLTPMITETRGPYSMLVWDAGERVIVCIGGAQGTLFCAVVRPVRTTALDPDAIAPESFGFDIAAAQQGQSAAIDGRVGANVTSVTLLLDDGSSVQTTVDNGWFAAWWPGSPAAIRSAEITTAAGTTTEPLNVPAPPPPVLPAGGATSGSGASGGTPTH